MRYTKEGIREEIRQALLVAPRTKGQLEGFESSGSSDRKYQTAPTRDIEICKDESGRPSFMKVKADVIRTLACKTFKKSPMPLAHNAFKHTQTIRAMNNASTVASDWMHYCYSDGAQIPSHFLLQSLLCDFNKQETSSLGESSQQLIKHLALLACMQTRDKLNANKLQLPQTRIAELAGKKEAAWKKTWAPRWNRLLHILNKYDDEGLNHVYEWQRNRKTPRRNACLPMPAVLQQRTGTVLVA